MSFLPFSIDLTTITSLIVTLLIVKLINVTFFGPLSKIPGPKRYAMFLGFVSYYVSRGEAWKVIQNDLHPKYGPIVRSGPSSVVIADKDAIKEMLITKDFPKSETYKSFRIFNETLFTTTSRTFAKQHRRMLAPAFSIKYITALEPLMKKCFEDVLEKINNELASSSGEAIIDIALLNNQWTLDIIGETALNGSFNMVKTGHHNLPEAVHNTLLFTALQYISPVFRLFNRSNSYLREVALKLLNKRRQHDTPKLDILQQLLDSGLSEEDIISQIIEFIFAGSDTTSFTATIALILLVKNPDKLDRLSKELDLEFGLPDDSKMPDKEKLKHLPYLNAVINESMRIVPVGSIAASFRVTPEDWIAGGYLIPKGTEVSASIYQLHHSTEYWGDDAHEFKPERWLDSNNLPKDVFYPFSAGSRSCIGMNFAMQELRMSIAIFAHRYHMEDIPEQDTSIVQYITPRLKKNEYKIRFSARNRSKA